MAAMEQAQLTGWDAHRARVARTIERSALELFAEEGADDVTIERIVAAAGVSKRTFFRYFATRDEILAALPGRALAQISQSVRSRPASESLLEAFAVARWTDDSHADRDLWLLWARVVKRSPMAAARALGRSMVTVEQTYRELVAERLSVEPGEDRAGVLGSAISAVVGYAFRQWVLEDGRQPLGKMIGQALETLQALDNEPPPTLTIVDG